MMPRARCSLAVLLSVAAAAGCEAGRSQEAGPSRDPTDPPTFVADVAPLLRKNCVACHRPGGAAPFPLLDYEDAAPRAGLIAAVTAVRRMPPWLPERPVDSFANERRLTKEEIALLSRWAAAGAPRGSGEPPPPPPSVSRKWRMGEPDLVVRMTRPYRVPPGGGEIFRNFVLPVPVDSTRWVEAVEIRPEDARVVHHATLSVDRTDSSRRLAAEDAEPGFDGMGPVSAAENPGGFFVGWTPGKVPSRSRGGVSWPLEPGTDLVLLLHLRPLDRPVDLRAEIGLYFASGPPERTPVVIRMGSESIEIPAGAAEHVIADTFALPASVDVLGLYPHAHYLATRIEAKAHLPNGSERWLIEIPRWDFDWQDEYRYAEPLRLPEGTRIVARFVYDNSTTNPRNPHHPPRRVHYGFHSTDEMADLVIQVLPKDSADAVALQRAAWLKALRIQVDGFRASLSRDPDDPVTHYNLGLSLATLGRIEEAIPHYRAALRIDPGHPRAHNNLATALHRKGDLDGAIRHYRRALSSDPDDARIHYNLGRALETEGEIAAAMERYGQAVRIDASLAPAHLRLGFLLGARGRIEESLARFRQAARLEPASIVPLVAMAEILATHPDARIRRPEMAITYAARAVELTDGNDPVPLSALAAAQAAAGRYQTAADTAERALERARRTGRNDLLPRLHAMAERYRSTIGP